MSKIQVQFDYFKCPLNRYTFKIADFKNWVEKHSQGKVLNLFAGYTKLNLTEVRVDLDEKAPCDYNMDAYDFVKMAIQENQQFDTIILDPPYALRKSMEMYGGRKISSFNKIKELLPDILCQGGKIITFGYHSVSMGRKRGFTVKRIGIFSHGGAIHDTIGTIEVKERRD